MTDHIAAASTSPLDRPASPFEQPDASPGNRAAVFQRIVTLFEERDVMYCILDGYARLDQIGPTSDLDCAVPSSAAPAIVALLSANAARIGASVVRWDGGWNDYLTLVTRGRATDRQVLRLDLHAGYQRAGCLFYSPDEILGTRRRQQGLWVPAPDVEFGCYLVKKIVNHSLGATQGARLSRLFLKAPRACEKQVERFWPSASVRAIVVSAASGDWAATIARAPALRAELLRTFIRRFPARATRGALHAVRCAVAPPRSSGMNVVFLGPDGAGKSTVIETISPLMRSVFGEVVTPGHAPAVLPWSGRNRPLNQPHALRARPAYQSIPKAFFWVLYYRWLHLRAVQPALRAGRLVVFHRSLIDALVDPRRYRYGGPRWLMRLVVRLLPAPDLVIGLDAPADIVQARKREVPPAETARQREAYRRLVSALPNGRILDAARPLNQVADAVVAVILRQAASRFDPSDEAARDARRVNRASELASKPGGGGR